jgi:hypothetical protein
VRIPRSGGVRHLERRPVLSRAMRVVLGLWAAAIYAWYWLGYLRGQP